ncbi:MAG: hypothetical protein M0026_00570 [Nocardiopsaceae bacterium]|nr:hypothetical protein [Nocardiopsaceae bacterium]
MRSWTRRQWGVALLGAALTVLLIGIPTGVVPTDLYSRMTPVLWWNYPVLAVTAVLEGLLLATYVAPIRPAANQGSKAFAGGLVSLFAVGCPVCNKLVVLAIGFGGALSYFAPVQPLLAVASLLLLGEALRRRLRALRECRLPSPRTDSVVPLKD